MDRRRRAPDEKGVPRPRVFLKLHPRLAPIKAAVLPLVNRDAMPDVGKRIYRDLKPHFPAFFHVKGSIGKRYRIQDEAGTPVCITVDGQTLEDQTVTFRDRDTLRQWRVNIDDCVEELRRCLKGTGP